MAKYLDHHAKMPKMSAKEGEKLEQGQTFDELVQDIVCGKVDRFGVTIRNVFIGENGESWCYTEAPNKDAVIKSHAARKVKLSPSDVIEVGTVI